MRTRSVSNPTHPTPDVAVAQLAHAQGGVVGHGQAIELGLHRRTISRRVAAGRWIAVFPCVYAIGHARLRRDAWWRAAVLASGAGAVLSHRSAGAFWRLRSWEGVIEVTTTAGGGRAAIDGIRRYRTRRLAATDFVICEGLRVTTPARTVVDLAEVHPLRALERVLDEGERRRLDMPIVPIPGRRGAGKVVALTGHRAGSTWTRSGHEEAMLALCRRAEVQVPSVNVYVEGWECDFVWPDQRVIVEVDGLDTHRTRGDIERDRRRDLELRLAGWHVLRVVRSQVDEGTAVLRLLAIHGIHAGASDARHGVS